MTDKWEPPHSVTMAVALDRAARHASGEDMYDIRRDLLASPLPECVAALKHARLGLAWAEKVTADQLEPGDQSIFRIPMEKIDALLSTLEEKEPADGNI